MVELPMLDFLGHLLLGCWMGDHDGVIEQFSKSSSSTFLQSLHLQPLRPPHRVHTPRPNETSRRSKMLGIQSPKMIEKVVVP